MLLTAFYKELTVFDIYQKLSQFGNGVEDFLLHFCYVSIMIFQPKKLELFAAQMPWCVSNPFVLPTIYDWRFYAGKVLVKCS